MSEAVRNKAGDIIKKAIPLNRLGVPGDIAGVVLFLVSPAAAYVTGQVITVRRGLEPRGGGRLNSVARRGRFDSC